MNRSLIKAILFFLFSMLALSFIFPLFWMLLNSVKDTGAIITGGSLSLGGRLKLENYRDALVEHDIPRYLLNSVMVTGSTIVLTIIVSTMLAFALARMQWRGRKAVLLYVTFGLLIPAQIVLVPMFVLVRSLRLVDNPAALVLSVSAFNVAMTTIIAYGFLRSLPREIEEAALIDGCGIFVIYFRIVLPLIKSAIAVMVINIFLQSWNEFMFALVLISTDALKTLPIGLLSYTGRYGTDFGGMFAAMSIASLVPLAVFFIFNKQVERAVTASSMLK
jgi:raffinose/stachyose/melibiose transport system permease protein